MVMRAGLSKELGPIAYGENEEEVFLGRSVARQQNMSEETAKKVDSEIKKFVEKGYDRAKKVLTDKIDDLHKLAKALLTYETLSGSEIEDIINKDPAAASYYSFAFVRSMPAASAADIPT